VVKARVVVEMRPRQSAQEVEQAQVQNQEALTPNRAVLQTV